MNIYQSRLFFLATLLCCAALNGMIQEADLPLYMKRLECTKDEYLGTGPARELFQALADNNTPKLVKILEEKKIDPNTVNESTGETPLFRAAQNGQTEMVFKLLEHGADANTARKDDNVTPLIMAAMMQQPMTVECLLKYGNVHVDSQCGRGSTALFYAAQASNQALVRILLEHKACSYNSIF